MTDETSEQRHDDEEEKQVERDERNFRVSWTVDVQAENAQGAAQLAWALRMAPTAASVFVVRELTWLTHDGTKHVGAAIIIDPLREWREIQI